MFLVAVGGRGGQERKREAEGAVLPNNNSNNNNNNTNNDNRGRCSAPGRTLHAVVLNHVVGAFSSFWLLVGICKSYIAKGIRRLGIGSFVRSSYVSTLCPVVIRPYL